MKNLLKIYVLVLTSILLSCSKENDSIPKDNKTSRIESFKITSSVTTGKNGGKTFYGSGSATGKSNTNVDGMFLSNYPLVEYRYLQEIKYDSVVTTVTDDDGNVLSEQVSMDVVSRDTIGVEKGIMYKKYEDGNDLISLYVGLDKEFLEDTELRIKFTVKDGLQPVRDTVGFLFISMLDESQGYSNNTVSLPHYDTVPIPKQQTKIVDNIPTFDENGRITGYSSGLELQRVKIKQLQIYNNWDVTRDFEITIISSNGSMVKGDFSLRFVTDEEYEKRQCWLNGTYDCKDYFEK